MSRGGAVTAGSVAGHLHAGKGYVNIKLGGKLYKAHRLAWLYVYGSFPVGEIDHVDGVRHHNWISNLRDVSSSENHQNLRKPKSNNQSGFLGVYPRRGRWAASIKVKGKSYFLGDFDSPEKASEAYATAKRDLHIK